MIDRPYNIFGSKDSLDTDVMVFLDVLPPTTEECKNTCHEYEEKLDITGEVNVNLAVVEDGAIAECFKGTIDEVNNSILATYPLHDDMQEFSCLVERPVERNVELKIARALRIILTLLSRTKYRKEVKLALKSNVLDRINTLWTIDFNEIDDFKKNGLTTEDCLKGIAFQIAQTYSLMCGNEIYTKGEARCEYLGLADLLNREPSEGYQDRLNSHLRVMLDDVSEYNDLQKVKE